MKSHLKVLQAVLCVLNYLMCTCVDGAEGTLRLNTEGVTYPRTYSGRLEVNINGVWGTVCDDQFHRVDARVACQELGYEDILFFGYVGSLGFMEASSLVPIWLSNLQCESSDTSLLNCSHDIIKNVDCSHSEDVGLVCLDRGSLRLAVGTTATHVSISRGRLEVYVNGRWGTVCNDRFGSTDAQVACRQLGYLDASEYGTVASLFESEPFSNVPTWLDELACTTSDTTLLSCAHQGIGIEDCSHREDVALFCSNSIKSGGSSKGGVIGGVIVFVLVILSIFVYVGVVVSIRLKKDKCYRNTIQEISSPLNVPPVTQLAAVTETTTTHHVARSNSLTTRPQQPHNNIPVRTRHLNFQPSFSLTTQPQQSPPACLTPSDPKLTNQPPPSYPAATCQLYVPEPHPVPPQFSPYTPPPDYQKRAEAYPPIATTAFDEPPPY